MIFRRGYREGELRGLKLSGMWKRKGPPVFLQGLATEKLEA